MKIKKFIVLVSVLLSAFVPIFFTITTKEVWAATSPTLSASSTYSILGASEVTCTGATTITGNVGVAAGTSITGFPSPCSVSPGTTQSNTQSAIDAQADNLTTFGALNQGCDYSYPSGQDLTLISPLDPGVYCSAGSFLLTGNLTLNGSGVFIFKTVSTLITSPGSSVTGSDSCNVWWRVGSSATLDTQLRLLEIFLLLRP
ncbi:MAG: hypothetical protein UW41_C0002G0105 [Candidatus Collierbacteria bacterium GW2011_GWC2_44_18]|uniref:Uncharacterized protein n=2 Tax=Microgenomates group TaxID=1794810 RepID=A0A0G1M648_9BACT|nr:MAG: hypothetical protein UW41_C0002G0105 [Candidatus Collierbacteria bacterium GW2011_GWC2_44_18]KKT67389.1 MAG: hypothetical protein UW60_C0007G0003 [Candidatus Woesebacteria bacterium GW2011_GWA2_44_33]